MLFYAQLRNKDAAAVIGMNEKQIALIKHRAVKEIRIEGAREAIRTVEIRHSDGDRSVLTIGPEIPP